MPLPHDPSALSGINGFVPWRKRVEKILRALDTRIAAVGERAGSGGGSIGPEGPQGPAGTVVVAGTNTVAPGTPASVTNGGTASAASLTFNIPEGAPGSAGASGGRWISTTGAPVAGDGAVGDWAIDLTSGQTYEKTGASTWTARLNLTGPAGGVAPGTRREVVAVSSTTNAPSSPAASGVEFNVLTATIPNPVSGRVYRVEAKFTILPGTAGMFTEAKIKVGNGAVTGGTQVGHAFIDHRAASRSLSAVLPARFTYVGTTGAANVNVVLVLQGQSGTAQSVAQSDRPTLLAVDEVL